MWTSHYRESYNTAKACTKTLSFSATQTDKNQVPVLKSFWLSCYFMLSKYMFLFVYGLLNYFIVALEIQSRTCGCRIWQVSMKILKDLLIYTKPFDCCCLQSLFAVAVFTSISKSNPVLLQKKKNKTKFFHNFFLVHGRKWHLLTIWGFSSSIKQNLDKLRWKDPERRINGVTWSFLSERFFRLFGHIEQLSHRVFHKFYTVIQKCQHC